MSAMAVYNDRTRRVQPGPSAFGGYGSVRRTSAAAPAAGSTEPVSFLEPAACNLWSRTFAGIEPHSSPTAYLDGVHQKIVAEYRHFLREICDDRRLAVTHRVVAGDDEEIRALEGGEHVEMAPESVTAEQFKGLHMHLVLLHDNTLALLRSRPSESQDVVLTVERGERIDAKLSGRKGFFCDLGYVGNYFNQQRALLDMREALTSGTLGGARLDLLKAVADPAARVRLPYRPSVEISTAVMPCNAEQEAVVHGLCHNIEGIQGPPGTGKSTLIYHITTSALPIAGVILVTAVQNKAIDAIAEKFAQAEGLTFIVYGNTERLGNIAKGFTLEAQVERDPEVVEAKRKVGILSRILARTTKERSACEDRLWRALYQRRSSRPARQRSGGKGSRALDRFCHCFAVAAFETRIRTIWRLKDELQMAVTGAKGRARARILSECRVVLATVATASGKLLRDEMMADVVEHIAAAVFDEAGTCSEELLPQLLNLPELDRIIAIGDQSQLPPFSRIPDPTSRMCFNFQRTGRCKFGMRCKFDHSERPPAVTGFFQRLKLALPAADQVPMLTRQYRMHPLIAGYISRQFYSGSLQTPNTVADARRGAQPALTWVQCRGQEEDRRSKSNPAEARALLEAYFELQESTPDFKSKSVMVLTFYKQQFFELRDVFRGAGIEESSVPDRGLRIHTVDQSQGSEADFVLISCVRSNPRKDIGFLKKPNRLNVAVSRARYRLIIVGDHHTVADRNQNWVALHTACRKGGNALDFDGGFRDALAELF